LVELEFGDEHGVGVVVDGEFGEAEGATLVAVFARGEVEGAGDGGADVEERAAACGARGNVSINKRSEMEAMKSNLPLRLWQWQGGARRRRE
jgi:hypothetical protein